MIFLYNFRSLRCSIGRNASLGTIVINIMKIPLNVALKSKIKPVWFLAACALLGAVTITATVMAWKIESLEDRALQPPSGGPDIVSHIVLD